MRQTADEPCHGAPDESLGSPKRFCSVQSSGHLSDAVTVQASSGYQRIDPGKPAGKGRQGQEASTTKSRVWRAWQTKPALCCDKTSNVSPSSPPLTFIVPRSSISLFYASVGLCPTPSTLGITHAWASDAGSQAQGPRTRPSPKRSAHGSRATPRLCSALVGRRLRVASAPSTHYRSQLLNRMHCMVSRRVDDQKTLVIQAGFEYSRTGPALRTYLCSLG